MAGDPMLSGATDWLDVLFQSAPAIDGGRSDTARMTARKPDKFQSAPAIDGGRSDDAAPSVYADNWFQSAPAIDGGRSGIGSSALDFMMGRFNPRPPSMAGDPATGSVGDGAGVVSIRARHRWRAIPALQPMPLRVTAVSIRARHRWRAIHQHIDRRVNFEVVSIRARHRWRAIPRMWACLATSRRFQSAPAIDGGRSSRRGLIQALDWRFNPRPPSMAGDPCPHGTVGVDCVSFQSAPAIDGGRSRTRYWCSDTSQVSIRARHRWRAIHMRILALFHAP